MSEITLELSEKKSEVDLPENLLFGRVFTEHLFEVDYDESKGGWHNPKIKKFSNLNISPAAMVFHYGQSIFEGLKAYKQQNGDFVLFRPDKNIERLNRSARKMCIPEVSPELVLNAMKELVKIDRDWMPGKPGHALYIRPVMFASEPSLGVRPSDTYKLIIMLSPVGPYYPEGFKPVPILVTDEYVRAVRKGIGDCKTAGNYAASILAQREAKKLGYSQVLWLDGIEQKYLEEVGTMNIFVQFKNEVATPMLTGSILPGVTRMSVIQILRDWGYTVNERMISIEEVSNAYMTGDLIEIFGTGTAAVISSISKLKFNDQMMIFNENEAGELGTRLYNELASIHEGKIPDRYGWNVLID
ncbi:MAG: branched-chain amino acid aminotransferase [Melioribacteraceae bacterium]|nr:branched-chain amino acid aminotransferase [Melioribacteraceae bacterium]